MPPPGRFRTACLAAALGLGGIGLDATGQPAGFPVIKVYSESDIGADPTGWITLQDADGVLHFGCRELTTFDGERWRVSSMNGAGTVRALDFGPDGRLWAAATGELGWFERTATGWSFRSIADLLPAEHRTIGEVWYVFAEKEGALFVTDEKVLRWDGHSFTVWSLTGDRRLIAFRIGDTPFVQHRSTGLYRITSSGPELVYPASVLGGAGIYWMEARADGWFIVSSQGVFRLSGGVKKPIATAANDFLQRNSPTHAVRIVGGRIAVGTLKGGIGVLRPDGSLERTLDETDGLPTRLITSLFVDRDHQLWGTSYTHIFRIALDSPSTVFDERSGLPPKPLRQIIVNEGRIFAAADDLIHHLPAGAKVFEPVDGLRESVWDMRPAPGGFVAAGLPGVLRMAGDELRLLHPTEFNTFVVQPAADGNLLVADGRRILSIEPGGRSRVLVTDLPEKAVSIARDWRGNLWLGTRTNGVLYAQPQASADPVSAVPAAISGLPALDGHAIVRASADGEVLVVLHRSNGWILRRGAEKFEPIAGYPRREPTVASALAPDGSLWVIHPSGKGLAPCVARVSTGVGGAIWEPHAVDGLDAIGAPRALFVEPAAPAKPVLWIGGDGGILRHAVERVSVPSPRPPLLRALASQQESPTLRSITSALPYATQTIEFEFAAPDFARRASLRLETRLAGVDPDWVPADTSSHRQLTALRDGRYSFQVRTRSEAGTASEPAVFDFEILPPWWRTAPAILGGILALVPLGYGSYWLRLRSLRRRNADLEHKVRQRTRELEEASAAKTQFVANMSHDIRNPLNGIVGLALALEDTRLDERQREIVSTLRECTTYLSTLVDDVLDFASIEAGRVEFRPGPYLPVDLLRSIVTALKADTAESGATLSVDVDPSVPANLLHDAGRIQQILVNFVSNALKYAGGPIRLSASLPPGAPDEVEFAVTDEGPGISAADQALLFSKFSRLEGARRAEVPGAGLGLASCRLLADLMGGSVGIKSSPGQGARFFLRLPLTVTTAPSPAPAFDLPNSTVLLVEDTDYNAWAATAVLAKLGLSAERARTGEEALRLYQEQQYNVVLLDRNLPDMDGTAVARRLRHMESDGRRAVILAVTAYCTAEDRKLCLDAGMDAFVGKPLTPEKLRRVLIAAGRRQLAAASIHVPPELTSMELDFSLLHYLSTGTGQDLAHQVDRFVATLDDIEDGMAQAARSEDLPRLAAGAHQLLGQARMVGAGRLAEAAAQLEGAAKARDPAACGERLQRVRDESAAVREALRRRHPVAQSA